MTFAPGKRDSASLSGPWRRDLGLDLDAIAEWGARLVLTLLENHEMARLGIANLGDEVRRRNMAWLHLPIRDVDTPSPGFEARWPAESARVRGLLAAGDKVLIHCRGGLGRAGMVAARLLVEMGERPETATAAVRKTRGPGAIETSAQESWVRAGVHALGKHGR